MYTGNKNICLSFPLTPPPAEAYQQLLLRGTYKNRLSPGRRAPCEPLAVSTPGSLARRFRLCALCSSGVRLFPHSSLYTYSPLTGYVLPRPQENLLGPLLYRRRYEKARIRTRSAILLLHQQCLSGSLGVGGGLTVHTCKALP